MHQKYENVLDHAYIDLYNKEQTSRSNFPFHAFDEALPLSWVKAKALHSSQDYYIPAQFVFVGYHIKKHLNEPWYGTAVTTGTAAHTDLTSALLGSILEIIQIDSTIGHWYGNYEIPQIVFDERTKPMQRLLEKYGNTYFNPARFFLLKNPDLLGFSIACILDRPENSIPRVSIGLGASTTLNDALYKAYLEAIGVSNLSNILILKETLYQNEANESRLDAIYDIDQNVALYGRGHHYDSIEKKFNNKNTIYAKDLAPDLIGSKEDQFKQLVNSFISSGKELIFIDLTNIEAKELGFYVPRLWSKDTLSLCFPSAAPAKHPRFKNYGGFSHDVPHPYP
jgi:thiazole/oxazole-forming peptide maturase SagD family component